MLDLINRYNHGYLAIPVILACRDRGLFATLEHGALSGAALVEGLNANSGHFAVALNLLESLGWLARSKGDTYSLTDDTDAYKKVPAEVIELYELPIGALLEERHEQTLRRWAHHSRSRWDGAAPLLADFLDGVLLVPTLLALRDRGLVGDQDGQSKPQLIDLPGGVRESLLGLFLDRGWTEERQGRLTFTDLGKFIADRALLTGTTASYRPMLRRMSEVLFEGCQAVFARDAGGHEYHVERTLNVIASGFQHKKYFADVEDLIVSIFDRLPFEEQPAYVADMGCGDGTFLKRVYETIRNRSKRGPVLALEKGPGCDSAGCATRARDAAHPLIRRLRTARSFTSVRFCRDLR